MIAWSKPEWASVWTPLLQAAVQASSEVEYRRGLKFFLDWLREKNYPPIQTAVQMDEALAEYGWHVFEEMGGRGKSRLHNAIYGVEHFLPRFQGLLKLARRSEVGWRFLRPPKSHSPINWALTCMMGQHLASKGHVGAGVAVLTGFDCYLRISEIEGIRLCDLEDIGVIVEPTVRRP